MKNSSGFYGYNVASVYPDMGDMMSDTMTTIPDPEDQSALSGIDAEKAVPPAVNPGHKKGVWIGLGVMVAFVFFFARG